MDIRQSASEDSSRSRPRADARRDRKGTAAPAAATDARTKGCRNAGTGSRQGHVGKKAPVAIGAIAAGALLVVVQASAGSSARDAASSGRHARRRSIKGVGASLQEVVRTARSSGSGRRQMRGRQASTSPPAACASSSSHGPAPSRAAKTAVDSHGGVVERSAAGLVQALVPVADLEALASDPAVSLVRRPYLHAAGRLVTGKESAAMNAPGYTNAGYDGTGVKIGIIDGGFAGYAVQARHRASRVRHDARLLRWPARRRPPSTALRWPRSSTRLRPAPSST